MVDLEVRHVVTCFVRAEAEVLLLRRSSEVGSYPGRWGAVAGHAEGDPDEAARREIEEETGFTDVELVRRGNPFSVEDKELGIAWTVHPYLFDGRRRQPALNEESTEGEWAAPPDILQRATVPELWRSYRAVAPSVADVRTDREHGSAYLSLRALEVLRDRAAEASSRTHIRALAKELVAARPSMAAVRNRINRAMRRCLTSMPDGGERAACIHTVLREAVSSDHAASSAAAEFIGGATVLTVSRSGTVLDALLSTRARVVVAVSLPGGEGVEVARRLDRARLDVTLIPDASMASAPPFDAVLLGCDTLLPDGSIVNKVGSRLAALVARGRGVPVYVAVALDKLLATNESDRSGEASEKQERDDRSEDVAVKRELDGRFGDVAAEQERADRSSVGLVSDRVDVRTEIFERVPADLIDAYATERGVIERDEVKRYAEEFREMEGW
ncbi:MAG: NUDIX domain-containing protein [Rhodothermales bacterium]